MSVTDRRNPIFYYEIKGLGGICLNPEGLEMTEGAEYEDAAKELFEAVSRYVGILRGKLYRVLTEKEYQEEYGDEALTCSTQVCSIRPEGKHASSN